MRWILQDFEDTSQLAALLERRGADVSMHKVVPFVGELMPRAEVAPGTAVICFGSYTMWRVARAEGWMPGVFKLRPFVREVAWDGHLLNGSGATFARLLDVAQVISADDRQWFMRPVDDSKEEPGRVRTGAEICALAEKVLKLPEDEIPRGALRHDTELMFASPKTILVEWRCWVVGGKVVTWSEYKRGGRVAYIPQIDDDALEFAESLVAMNADYADAYVLDVCRTPDGLRMIETNCINAAGFYAADLGRLVDALEGCFGG